MDLDTSTHAQLAGTGPEEAAGCGCRGDNTVLITEAPVRVTAVEKQPLRSAVDVSGYAGLDVELQVLEGTDVEVRLLTGLQIDSDEGWMEVDRFVATTSKAAGGSTDTRRTPCFPLLRYARWEVLGLGGGGGATFLLHGRGRRRLAFVPTQLDSCVVWLRADRGVTLVSGNVSSWDDKSGWGNGVSQSTSTKRPTWVASAVNGQPAISFDGADDHLKGSLAATLAGTNQDFTIFVVANVDSTTPGGNAALYELSDSLGSSDRGPMHFYEDPGGGGFTYVWRCFDSGAGQASYSSPPFDSWHRHAGWHQTGDRRIYLDNVEQASSGVGVSSRDLTVHSVGMLKPDNPAGGGIYPLKGQIAEIIVYQRKLGDSEMALLDQYLTARYAL